MASMAMLNNQRVHPTKHPTLPTLPTSSRIPQMFHEDFPNSGMMGTAQVVRAWTVAWKTAETGPLPKVVQAAMVEPFFW